MIILRLLLLLTNLHLKLLSTQGTGADKLLSTQRVKESTVCALNSLSAVTWQKVRVATSSDADMNLLLATIESGIPKYRHEMAQSIRKYHQFRDELYSVDGVVNYKDRVVIPPSLRNEVLLALHVDKHCCSYMLMIN